MSEILRWERVKTRKPHRCFGCDKIYPVGEYMISAAYAEDGTASSTYWCDTCIEYMDRHFESGDETSQGEIFANDPEEWHKIKAESKEATHNADKSGD